MPACAEAIHESADGVGVVKGNDKLKLPLYDAKGRLLPEKLTRAAGLRQRFRVPGWIRHTWTTIIGVLAVIQVFLFYIPRVQITSPSAPLDSNDPFTTSLDIVNEAPFPLRHVTASLGIGQVAGGGMTLDPNFMPNFEGSQMANFAWMDHNLGSGDRFTIVLSDVFRHFSSADIAVIVTYYPWYIPIKKTKIVRYVTYKRASGQYYWKAWPLNEKLNLTE